MASASFISLYNTAQTTGSEYRFQIYSYDSSHLHKVVLKCGSYTKTWDRIKGGVETTYTVPMEWANAMPNATSMNGTLTLTTYQSNYTTKVGSSVVKDVRFNVSNSIKPTVSLELEETVDGIAEQFGAYVQGKSRIGVTITASGSYGSTIRKYNTTINDVTYTSSSFTTGYMKTTSSGNSESKSCSATVTDSRGRTDTELEVFVVYTYSKPKINNFTVARCLADGTLNDEGTFVKVVSNATINDVKEKNTKAFKLSYKLMTEDDWTEIELPNESYTLTDERILSGFDINSTYNLKLEATDFFETVSKVINLETSDNIMDFLADGTGMAIGKAAEHSDTLDVGYSNTYISKNLYMGGNRKTDDEKVIWFQSTGDGTYDNNMRIYGGNGTSPVGLGVFDVNNEHRVVHYTQNDETLHLDAHVKMSGFAHCITLYRDGVNHTITHSDTYEQILFDNQIKAGSKLSLSSNGVLIGSGVKKVKISGTFEVGIEGGTGIKYGTIFRNDTQVHRCYQNFETKQVIALSPRLITVTEGDLISLKIYAKAGDVVNCSYATTQLTVEVVE